MRGAVEYIDYSKIWGWASDGEDNLDLRIQVLFGGEVIGEGNAYVDRVGPNTGFEFEIRPPANVTFQRFCEEASFLASSKAMLQQPLPVWSGFLTDHPGWSCGNAGGGAEKIAYCILALRAPSILRQTIDHLQNDKDIFIVHVDAKADIKLFTSALNGVKANVEFISERVDIGWGGFSMVRAQECLFWRAIERGCTHVALISDDSLPLWPSDQIRKCIASERFSMHFYGVTSLRDHRKELFNSRYEKHHYFGSHAANITAWKTWYDHRDLEMLEALVKSIRAGKPAVELQHGSQWWSGSSANLRKLLEFGKENVSLRNAFQFSFVPDEHYFQTIAHLVHVQSSAHKFMLVDFSVPNAPRVFTEEDAEIAKWRRNLFVRKVSPNACGLYNRIHSASF